MTEKPAYMVVCGEVRRVDADNPIDCTLILHDHGGAVCNACTVMVLSELNGLAAQVAQFRAERDMWKSNHDNQVAIKRAVLDRPDLKERATLVQALISERDQLRADNAVLAAEVEAWRIFGEVAGRTVVIPVPPLDPSHHVRALIAEYTEKQIAVIDAEQTTDASGALARAKEIK